MKKLVTTLLVLFLMGNLFYAQSKTEFGFTAGLAIPTGDIADFHNTGFDLGFSAKFPTSESMGIVAGFNYASLSGEEINLGFAKVEVENADIISLYAGTQFGKEKGIYFLPALALNFIDDNTRVGIDLGTGFLIPVGEGAKLNIGIKFNMTNLIGKDDGENAVNVFKIIAGINF